MDNIFWGKCNDMKSMASYCKRINWNKRRSTSSHAKIKKQGILIEKEEKYYSEPTSEEGIIQIYL